MPRIAAYLIALSCEYNITINHGLNISLTAHRVGGQERGQNARGLKVEYGVVDGNKLTDGISGTLFEGSSPKLAEAWLTVFERLIAHKYERLEELEEALQSW